MFSLCIHISMFPPYSLYIFPTHSLYIPYIFLHIPYIFPIQRSTAPTPWPLGSQAEPRPKAAAAAPKAR